MNSIFRKTTLVLLVIFALSITGCLSNNVNQPNAKTEVNDKKEPVVKPPVVKPPVVEPVDGSNQSNVVVYDPFANKPPMVTQFTIEELDEAVVAQGQTIELKAAGLDPEGTSVEIIYEATAGKIDGNKWTAPDYGGIFEVKAFASDGLLNSDPEIISLKVPGNENGISVSGLEFSAPNQAQTNGPSRAITSTAASTASNKVLLETSESIDITLTFSSNNAAAVTPDFSAASNSGTMEVKSYTNDANADLTTGDYQYVFTYTTAASAPTGNTNTITFYIVNTGDATDYASVSVTFIINALPQINTIAFSDGIGNYIAPSTTKTLVVTLTANDANDTYTYFYEPYENTTTANLAESTNTSGQVDYTSNSTAGTEKILVIVTDQRGGKTQQVFSITNAAPMSLALADDTIDDEDSDGDTDYDDATYGYTDGTVQAEEDITTNTVTVGTTTEEQSTPVQTQLAASLYDGGVEAYTDNVPTTGTLTYLWEDAVTIGGSSTKILNDTTWNATANTTANPDFFATFPGKHTVSVKTTKNSVEISKSDDFYVNEMPYISSVSYTDDSGATVSLWNGTTEPTITPQVSPGQLLTLNVGIVDADNTRVNPFTDANGYFSDTDEKFLAIVPNSANWSNLKGSGGPGADQSSQAQINAGSGYTNNGIAGGTLASISSFTYEIKPQATSGTGVYQYVILRVDDNMSNDAAATAYTITSDPVGLAVLPSVNGIPKAFDADNTGTDVDTAAELTDIKIGYDPQYTTKNGNYYLIYTDTATVADGDPDAWKIYDIDAGAYLKDTSGTDITFAANSGNGTLAAADTVDTMSAQATAYDWLLIDIDTADANLAEGDKVYFKTYAHQVIAKFEVITGPKINSVSYNKYVTLGQTSTLTLFGDNDGDAATATMTLTSGDGTLAQGTDSDGDEVAGEIWIYTAPTTLGSDTVKVNVSITDNADSTKKITREITFYLNRNPVIGVVNATNNVDTTDGNWIKKGTHNISLSALVSDSDTSDSFNYLWNLQQSSTGRLDFTTAASSLWDPYNGATALTATGGPTLNGQYPIQLQVTDKDTAGLAKGGIAVKTVVIGVNEDPTVASVTVQEADLDPGAVATDYDWDATLGASWNADGGTDVATAAGVTTLDFDTNAQFLGVRINAEPQTVSDEPDDINSLTYTYFLTKDTPSGNPVTTEKFEYYNVTGATVTTKGLYWEPSVELRRSGGTYYLHTRITDAKNGVAKGILDQTDEIRINRDATAPDINDVTNGVATDVFVYKNGVLVAANDTFFAGDELKIRVNITPTANHDFRDLSVVTADIGEILLGDGAAAKTISLTRNDNGTATNYTDDYLEYTKVIQRAIVVADAVDSEGGNDVNIQALTAYDISGNVDAAIDFGLDLNVDNDPPVAGDFDLTTGVTVAAGDIATIVNDNDAENGNTILPDNDDVFNIGDEYAWEVGIGAPIIGAANTDDEDTTTGAIDLTTLLNVSNLEANWTALGSDAVNDTAEIAAEVAFAESPNVQTWELEGANALTYIVDYYLEDEGNRTYGTADLLNPTGVSTALTSADFDGIDLRRPSVSSVEVYSYDKTAAPTESGWAPVIDRSNTFMDAGSGDTYTISTANFATVGGQVTLTAANAGELNGLVKGAILTITDDDGDVAQFRVDETLVDGDTTVLITLLETPAGGDANIDTPITEAVGSIAYADLGELSGIDYTIAGAASVSLAKDNIDDLDTSTAEIVKIVFDEPLYVGHDQALVGVTYVGAADDDDGTHIGSTVNDYSLAIKKYRSDGINTDDVSQGVRNDVANNAAIDDIELDSLKNYAVISTGGTTTDTTTVYILLQSKVLDAGGFNNGNSAINAAASGTLNFPGSTLSTDGVAVNDIIELWDDTATQLSYFQVDTVVSETELTVTNVGTTNLAAIAVGAEDANDNAAVSVSHNGPGSFFEVIFADYSTETFTGVAADMFKVICDSHGNAINATANNYTKGQAEISW